MCATTSQVGSDTTHHPLIGDIELLFEAMPIGPDQTLTLMVYPAEPGSEAENSLRLLASWTLPNPSRADQSARTEPGTAP